MKSEHKNFKTLSAWKSAAKKSDLKVRKVSVSLSRGEYWQVYQEGTIVGYFLTGSKSVAPFGRILREVL